MERCCTSDVSPARRRRSPTFCRDRNAGPDVTCPEPHCAVCLDSVVPSDDEAGDQVDALQEVQRVLLHLVGGGFGSR